MKIIKWLGWAVGIGLAGVAIASLMPDYDDARAGTDRQTINCMSSQLTLDDKRRIAGFADSNDFDSLWRVYDRLFPDCMVRSDQRDRKAGLESSAWQQLSSDSDFMMLRESHAAHAAQGQ